MCISRKPVHEGWQVVSLKSPLGPALQGSATFAQRLQSFCPLRVGPFCVQRALGNRPEEAMLWGLPAVQSPSGPFIAHP